MSNLQKIVTFRTYDNDDVAALTRDEFTSDEDFAEWVWHMAPTKEAAIARHDDALDNWENTGADYFIHGVPA